MAATDVVYIVAYRDLHGGFECEGVAYDTFEEAAKVAAEILSEEGPSSDAQVVQCCLDPLALDGRKIVEKELR